MKRGSLYGKNSSVARKAIADREDFYTSGALKGKTLTDGRYVVYSYAEPIFLYAPETGWIRTLRRFSATTSRHQGFVGGALAGALIPVTDTSERIRL